VNTKYETDLNKCGLNNFTVIDCKPFIGSDENTWIISIPIIVPLVGLSLIIILFLRGSIFIAIKLLFKLKFNDALKALKIQQLLGLNIKNMKFFYMESPGRMLTSSMMVVNFVFLICIVGLQIHWRVFIGYCEKYDFLNEAYAFYLPFSIIVLFITISLVWSSIIFCAGFYQSTNEEDRAPIHFTGIYNGESLFYFNGISGKRHRVDLGSLIALILITVMNTCILLYGILVIIYYRAPGFCADNEVLAMSILSLILGAFAPLSVIYFIFCLISLGCGCINKTNFKLPPIPAQKGLPNLLSLSNHDEEKDLDVKKEDELELLKNTITKQWNHDLFMYFLKINGLSKYEKNLGFLSVETFKGINIEDLIQNGVNDEYHQQSFLTLSSSLNLVKTYENEKRKPKTWNIDQVIEFMEHLEINNASSMVKKYAIHGAYLISMNDSQLFKILDLESTLINSFKIQFLKKTLNEKPRFYENEGFESWDNQRIQKFFSDNGLGEYCKKVKQLRLFGALIPSLKVNECLKELEIKEIHYNSVLTAFENIQFPFMTIQQVLDWVSLEFDKSLQTDVKKHAVHGAFLMTMDESYICEVFPSLRDNRLKRKAFIDKIDLIRGNFKMIVRPLFTSENLSFNPEYSSMNPTIEDISTFNPDQNILNLGQNKVQEFNPFGQSGFDNDDEEKMCKICFDRLKNTLTMPCNHIAMCEKCANLVTSCPICREPISTRIKTFSVYFFLQKEKFQKNRLLWGLNP
jgi:hypothetical protein